MMILHLVKKDFLLIKKNLVLMMLLAIAVPLFVSWRVPAIASYISFIFTVVFTELLICQAVAVEEGKYPKVAALLCSAPYLRKTVVKAKYAFFLLLFVYCYVIYTLTALIVPNITMINLSVVLVVLLFGIILYGSYLPAYFKYGFEKTKIFFIASIFLLSFGTPLLYNYFADVKLDLSAIELIPAAILNLALILMSAAVLSVSVIVSSKIYSKKEL